MPLTDDEVRQAWEWYQAEPQRTWVDAERHFGVPAEGLRQWAQRQGLPSKQWHKRPRRRVPMTYGRILDAYHAGATVEELAAQYGQYPRNVLDILRSAGEVCTRCEILLARNEPYGIAVLASGDRVCQECVEESGCEIERWERQPVVHNVVGEWE